MSRNAMPWPWPRDFCNHATRRKLRWGKWCIVTTNRVARRREPDPRRSRRFSILHSRRTKQVAGKLFLVAVLLGALGSALHGQDGASLVLLNGKVWTGDASQPEAEAIAVRGSRILATGSSEAMRKLALPNARI